jgi:hypothetical protein
MPTSKTNRTLALIHTLAPLGPEPPIAGVSVIWGRVRMPPVPRGDDWGDLGNRVRYEDRQMKQGQYLSRSFLRERPAGPPLQRLADALGVTLADVPPTPLPDVILLRDQFFERWPGMREYVEAHRVYYSEKGTK